MKTPVIIAIVGVLVILGVAGWYWYTYSHSTDTARLGQEPAQTTTATSTQGHRFSGIRGGFATGSIEILNDNGFTLTLQDGTTKNVNITATTTIENFTTPSSTPMMETVDQLSVGEQVTAIGSPNPDGSINAVRVLTGSFPMESAFRPRPVPQPD